MEKQGLIDLSELKPRNYDTFFLKRNPFPGIGVPSDTIPFTVDREDIKKRFTETIAELQENETGLITVLIGDYGSGKSHLLKLFKQSVNTYLLSQNPGILAVYVKSPGEDFGEFFSQFIDDIGRSLLTAYSQEIFKEYFISHRSESLKHFSTDELKAILIENKYEIGDMIKKSRYLDLFNAIKNEKFSDIGSNDLVYAFLSLSHPDLSTRAWKWFLMDKIDKKDYREHLLIESPIDNEKIAYVVFKNLTRLLNLLKIQSLVILVDELEKIGSLSPSQKRIDYQEQLRTLIDDYPKNLCLFFAIAPTQWDELTKTSTAFIRRLAGTWARLDDFKKEDTKELIETYLHFSRVKNYNSQKVREKFPDCEPSLCPFTKDSIDSIQQESDGRVSRVLMLCRKSLEYLYDHQEKYKSINSSLIKDLQNGR